MYIDICISIYNMGPQERLIGSSILQIKGFSLRLRSLPKASPGLPKAFPKPPKGFPKLHFGPLGTPK